jgi:hypothetical protein
MDGLHLSVSATSSNGFTADYLESFETAASGTGDRFPPAQGWDVMQHGKVGSLTVRDFTLLPGARGNVTVAFEFTDETAPSFRDAGKAFAAGKTVGITLSGWIGDTPVIGNNVLRQSLLVSNGRWREGSDNKASYEHHMSMGVPNMALGRPAGGSMVKDGGFSGGITGALPRLTNPLLAVDGIDSGGDASEGHCYRDASVHVDGSPSSSLGRYWYVDVGRAGGTAGGTGGDGIGNRGKPFIGLVTIVGIHNTLGMSDAESNGLKVSVGSSPDELDSAAECGGPGATWDAGGGGGNVTAVPCNLYGRVVFVQRKGGSSATAKTPLTLCEVRVYESEGKLLDAPATGGGSGGGGGGGGGRRVLTLDDDTNSVSAHGGGWTQVVTIRGNSQLHLWPEATSRKYSDAGEFRTVLLYISFTGR